MLWSSMTRHSHWVLPGPCEKKKPPCKHRAKSSKTEPEAGSQPHGIIRAPFRGTELSRRNGFFQGKQDKTGQDREGKGREKGVSTYQMISK